MNFSSRRIRLILMVLLAAVGTTVCGCVYWILESPVVLSGIEDPDLLVVDTVFSFGVIDGFTLYRFGTIDLGQGHHRFIGYGLLPAQKYFGFPFSSEGSRVFFAGFGGRVFELSKADGKMVEQPLLKKAGLSEFCVTGDTIIWREGSSVPFYKVSHVSGGTIKTLRPGGISLFLVGCSDERALFDTRLTNGSRAFQEVSLTTARPPENIVESSKERFVLGDVNWPSGELTYLKGDDRHFFSRQLAEPMEMPRGKNIFIGENHLYLCEGADPCNIEVRDKKTIEIVGEYSIPGACVYLFELSS